MNISISISLGSPLVGGASYTFTNSEAAALVSRFTIQPTNARKARIDDLYTVLKAVGLSKFDAFYDLAAHDAQAAQQNFIQNAYNLTPVASPTFTIDRGYQGDGATSYLSTGFDPTVAPSPRYTQNDCHMGLWSLTSLPNAAANSHDMGEFASGYIARGVSGTNASVGKPQSSTTINMASNAYPGHAAFSRSASNLWEAYAQGVDAGGGTDASVALVNQQFRILSSRVFFGVNQIAAAHFGANLTAGEMLQVRNGLNAYLTGIGAI